MSLDIWERTGSTAELLQRDLNQLVVNGGRVVSVVPNPYIFGPDRMSVLVVIEHVS